ncbi:large subunit ribosomal protein L4 [Labedaea rhizosphaerae]|uniref:Large ribosomal subunit protein uL4 n=1 Tax=Labedaea rhizosphaerae TaxID=598644 RepID=A0A4R6SP63_LABRH|nr:large subunit ribosomal protein L4 [Labedaea rhizosphaerae]
MTSVEIMTPEGKTDGSVDLPADVFDVQANIALMHQVVVAQQAAARQGTHATKTRGEVRGGGKKPYRQKGTGRARQGSTRAPQFAGGGVVHGPQPRDYTQRTPKKMKAAALRGALSDRARAGQVHVVSSLIDGDTPSTKAARKLIEGFVKGTRVLVVLTRDEDVNWVSVRNLPSVHVIAPDQLNTYDVLVNDDVVFSKLALDAFLAGPVATGAKGRSAKATASSDEVTQPYGAGSHAPIAGDAQPEGFPIKGNASSKLYHVPGSAFYDRTVAEVWFADTESAEAAGFQLPPSQRKDEDK